MNWLSCKDLDPHIICCTLHHLLGLSKRSILDNIPDNLLGEFRFWIHSIKIFNCIDSLNKISFHAMFGPLDLLQQEIAQYLRIVDLYEFIINPCRLRSSLTLTLLPSHIKFKYLTLIVLTDTHYLLSWIIFIITTIQLIILEVILLLLRLLRTIRFLFFCPLSRFRRLWRFSIIHWFRWWDW